MSDYQDNQPAQQGGLSTQHVVESASGTTSPDNSNSGPASYVIFIVGIAVLALLLSTVLGFLAAIMPYVMQEIGSSVNGTTVNLGSYSPNQIIRGAAAVPFAINLAGCRGLRNINVTLTTTALASNRTMLGNILTMNQATGVGVEISGVANGYSPQMVLLPNDTTSVYSEQRDTSGDDNIYGTSENGKNQSLTLNFLATLKRDGNQKIGSGNFKANGIFTLDYP